MRLEIIIDKKHQIPTTTMEALRQELLKQLGEKFPDLHVRVAGRRHGDDGQPCQQGRQGAGGGHGAGGVGERRQLDAGKRRLLRLDGYRMSVNMAGQA